MGKNLRKRPPKNKISNQLRVQILGLAALALCSFESSNSYASVIIKTNPFSAVDQFGLSPFWKWKTIESENFRITFPAELEKVANKTAQYYEEAHRLLSPLLQWQPHYKTQVLLIDNEDSANGLASPLARLGMVLWMTPPDNWFSTAYYDDWLRLLVIHEYTHFLNIDATSGAWSYLRYIFGDTLLPNGTWAPWMLEGLAVYMETRFTKAGRGRGPYYEMAIRAAVEAGVLDTPEFIQINQITGTNPYFPRGDTRYQFGYHLMNQVAKQKLPGLTSDGITKTQGGDEILGIMSKRGSARIPFFINGNLENITGKDWYKFWQEWVNDTNTRMKSQLAILHSQPTTKFKTLTEVQREVSNEVTGTAISPDGKWIAYTLVSADRRQGLYLRNLQTDRVQRLDDKLAGVGMSFTPDSKALIYSELNVINQYYTLSDLKVYLLEKNSNHSLTEKLRARDPHLSPDGKWITFTYTENAMTGLALAPLVSENEDYSIGSVQKIYVPSLYDRVANPKFSSDGKKIIFTLHPNGKPQEDILEYDLNSTQTQVLISNGKYNRYPTFDSEGDLYFVSNATGVDNLYRYNKNNKTSELVTNMTTGIAFPAFVPNKDSSHLPKLYAAVFSYTGWNLAQVDLLKNPIDPKSVTLAPPPAPEPVPQENEKPEKTYSSSDYSVFPSILPRTWSPLLGADASGTLLGAQTLGFDATNQHRYMVAGSYGTQLQVADGFALYSNRTLGPAFNLSASVLTNNVNKIPTGLNFSREMNFSASASYPILHTYSSLTPSISFNAQKLFNYKYDSASSQRSFINASSMVPNIDSVLTYSNLESSNLSITAEGGRLTQLGARNYLQTDSVWKLLFTDEEHIRLAKHTVLIPSFKAMWVTRTNSSFASSNAVASGRTLQQVLGAFEGDDFDQLSIRGYPGRSYYSRAVTVGGLDLRFPIARIFGGWGTNPLFLDNLYGLAFAEASYFPYSSTGTVLPSAGAGLRLSTEIFFFPITFSGEYHYGFQTSKGGGSDLFFQILAQGLRF